MLSLKSGLISRIREHQDSLVGLPDARLSDLALELRYRVRSGLPINRALPEGFALVCESAKRTIGLSPYDVQLQGALELARCRIIEMETGQGKTLTATFPLFIHSLAGQGAHLATANDYLAQRDANEMAPLFQLLRTSVGFISESMSDVTRLHNYQQDITYASATELGFDFLRDRLKRQFQADERVMRRLHFVIADEADAVMIDEANTPLIIGANATLSDTRRRMIMWAAEASGNPVPDSFFRYSLRKEKVELTTRGRTWVHKLANETGLRYTSILDLYRLVEIAIQVNHKFLRDHHYIVRNNDVVLINESNGRLGEGRQWQDGIHQAIQARESLPITAPSTHAAKITIQNLFLSYRYMAGMSGTTLSAAKEFRKVYRRRVSHIPSHQVCRRRFQGVFVYRTEREKVKCICGEISRRHSLGRPVLVGTRSVEKSEMLSRALHERGLNHQVLNARQNEAEAETIARAGRIGAITVATGMAGRGTDIKLEEGVDDLGGLHVILSELHDSPRMDRQLIGRCARQGDNGSYRVFLSLDDAILRLAYGAAIASAKQAFDRPDQAVFDRAQRLVERRKFNNRTAFLYQEKRRLRSLWQMGADPILDSI